MKFDYSRIPDPMEKYKQLGIEITDDVMDTIIQLRNQIEAAKKDFEKKGYFGGIFMWLESHSCFAFVVLKYF